MTASMSRKPTRCAIYLRISLDATGEQLAVQRQREDCRRIAEQRGWVVIAEFVDNSISASDKRKIRPGYDALVAAFAAGQFEALVCYDLDRLTRQPRQLEDWIDAATDRGLLLVTANGEADLSTDGGRMYARIKASVARGEVERKSARQKRAAVQRSENGKPPLGTRLTGYTSKGEVIESEAKVVRKLFARFAAGDSLRSLAAWLTTSKVPTRRGGSRWNPSTVATMLRNPRYAGRAIYDGRETGRPGGWDPLVGEDVFSLVQARLADPRRKVNRHGTDRKHLGSGLFECAVCGRKVVSFSGDRYRCPSACVNRSRGPVETYVLEVIRARLARPDLAELITPDSGEAREVGEDIARLRARLATIGEDYDAGLIDGQRFAVATEKVRAELAQAEAALARLASGAGVATTLLAADPVAAFDAAPLMVRREVIEALCSVRLGHAPRGSRRFDPDTVKIEPKV